MTSERVAEIKRSISYLRDLEEIREVQKHVHERVKTVAAQVAERSRNKKVAYLKGLKAGVKVLVVSGKHRGIVGKIIKHGRKYISLKFESDAKYTWTYPYACVTHPFEEDEPTRQAQMGKLDKLVNGFFEGL